MKEKQTKMWFSKEHNEQAKEFKYKQPKRQLQDRAERNENDKNINGHT